MIKVWAECERGGRCWSDEGGGQEARERGGPGGGKGGGANANKLFLGIPSMVRKYSKNFPALGDSLGVAMG